METNPKQPEPTILLKTGWQSHFTLAPGSSNQQPVETRVRTIHRSDLSSMLQLFNQAGIKITEGQKTGAITHYKSLDGRQDRPESRKVLFQVTAEEWFKTRQHYGMTEPGISR